MFLLLVLASIGVASATVVLPDKPYYDLENAHNLFKEFLLKYNKEYSPDEYWARLENFKESLKDINYRNTLHPGMTFDVNHFADLTKEERQKYRGLKPWDESIDALVTKLEYSADEMTAPDNFDWRDKNVVTIVKNQRDCGSCWDFSAVGNIEGQYAMKYKKLVIFSEQMYLDCSIPADGISNCDGGWPHEVMFFSFWVGAITAKDYPYTARPKKCRYNKTELVFKTNGVRIYRPDENTLKELLFKNGPLSVTLDGADLDFYRSGILRPKFCQDGVSHAVLLVGYGEEKGVKYWILKNSWGEIWGEAGYFRLLRGVNACAMGTKYTATCTMA